MGKLHEKQPYLLGVIAGTPFDTALGASYAESLGLKTICLPLAKSPLKQTLLQTNESLLQQHLLDASYNLKNRGCTEILIFCISICFSADIDSSQRKTNIPIMSPIDIFRATDWKDGPVAIFTANAQCASKMEKAILNENRNTQIIGISSLPVINAIEISANPTHIITTYNIIHLLDSLTGMGCQQIILACTHFKYIWNDLKKLILNRTDLKVTTLFEGILENRK